MVVKFRCRLSWRRILAMAVALLALVVMVTRKGKQLMHWLSAHRFSISVASSILLGLLNILVYNIGCPNMKPLLDPVKLFHGFVPVFPSHFFHGPDLTNVSITLSRQTLEQPQQLDLYLHSHILQSSLSSQTTPVVHIIWCDSGPFTFTHYLSVLASFKVISPSVLYLHLIRQPYIDPDGYFQFLPDLLRDLPPLIIRNLPSKYACYGNAEEKTVAYLSIVGSAGGIVINGRTVLAPSPALVNLLSKKISISVQKDDNTLEPLIVTAQAKVVQKVPTEDSLKSFLQSHDSKYYRCSSAGMFSLLDRDVCVYVQEDIFPVFVFNSSSQFHRLARWISYGTSGWLMSAPSDSVIVPNIVHYVWLGQNQLNFFAYLSVMSSLYVLGADTVYVHGDHKPLGDFWTELKQHPRVKFIHRDFPTSVFGEPIKRFASHASDYLRGDILLRYGGVYADWDVIFLQQLPHTMRLHQTTASVDWPETGAFPDVFNLGVLVSAPGAPFLRHFLESYRWYLDRDWSYNAIHIPYKVYEKQPRSLNVDRHLQILCALNTCHATWLPDYKQDSTDHLNPIQVNWQADALAIHWTHPDPVEFRSKQHLLSSDTVIAQIGKFVLNRVTLNK
ncbi:unnamed protein product [Candidula unifasciata]|uniref:Glycosyltransferase n=1 Tax=Candidula unifasciata TaxID=100452 RepID=A0A8S4A037_9EUPU|nr:unnamed protein product [Candidula unifasciata]